MLPKDLCNLAEGHQPDIWTEIDTLVLVRETTYPSLKVETMMSASLAR